MSDIAISPARPKEADALTALVMRSKQSNGYDDAFMAACVDELAVTAAHIKASEFWVARDSDTLCGCACLYPHAGKPSAEVHWFFIDPDHKRRGIGRLLWAKLIDRAMALNIQTITLDADPEAVPFYLAMGAKIVGEAPSGSIKGRTLPKMQITLEAD